MTKSTSLAGGGASRFHRPRWANTRPPNNRRASTAMRCVIALGILLGGAAHGQTCTMQSKMSPADRDDLSATGRKIAFAALGGDFATVRGVSIPALQADFAGVQTAVSSLHDSSSAGAVTVHDVYLLEVPANGSDEAGQFFCQAQGSATQAATHIIFTLPGLKAGRYGIVLAHVSGVIDARQISLVLQDAGGWKLAGFVQKPLEQAGHDGLWYWQQGREFVKRHQPWNARLALQLARELITPAGFVSSTNLERLEAEEFAAQPVEWPSIEKPWLVPLAGHTFSVTGITAAIATHNSPGIVLTIRYTGEKAVTAPAGVAVQSASAVQQEFAAEIVRRVPELATFVTQLLMDSSDGQTSMQPVRQAR